MSTSQSSNRVAIVFIALIIGAVFLLSCFGIAGGSGCLVQPASASLPLLQLSDLQYVGAFRVPAGQFGASRFGYGGTAIAYNPANNSLFMVGHDWDQMVAEISIPQIVNSNQLSDLQIANVLQGFADPSEGRMQTVDDGTINVGGLLVSANRLYGSAYSYYDADASQILSHYTSTLDLALSGDVQGMFQLGTLGAGFVSGYMTWIPTEWQSLFGGIALVGNCCLPIISRTSYGPALFAFNPGDLGTTNPVPVTPLVYYPSSHPLDEWDATSTLFNGTTTIRGVVFPQGTRSILFFGKHGIGAFCYGTGGTNGDCYDPDDPYQGTHAYPYVNQIWAFDAVDLLAAPSGRQQPWDVRPYGVWTFDLPFPVRDIGGAAYDAQTNRIFVSQTCAEGVEGDCRPVVHVFQIAATCRSYLPLVTR